MSRHCPVAFDPPADDMSRLLDVVAQVVLDVSDGRGLGRITPEVSFERGLGLASLERVELTVRARAAFGVQLPDDVLHAADTPAQLLSLLVGSCERPGLAPGSASMSSVSAPPVAWPEPLAALERADAATVVEVLEHRARHPEEGMRAFKLGAFWLAGHTGAPVVPVVIRGSRRALLDGTWLPRRHPIEVEVLEPIRARGRRMEDLVELRDRCAQAIAARLDEPWLHGADIRVHDREVHGE